MTPIAPRGPVAAAALLAALLAALPAFAWVHIARAGETLDQLAVRYYGRAQAAIVIRAANGFVHPDDGSLTPGERVEIPEVDYHAVSVDETWESIAEERLASPLRGPFLAELNGYEKGKPPPVGTIIKIPYHLRHIFAAKETLKSVAEIYYGKKVSAGFLRDYNLARKRTYGRGSAVIVPLVKLDFTEEERRRIDAIRAASLTAKEAGGQEAARGDLAAIKRAYDTGLYVEVVARANQLLGRGHLTVPQEIGVSNYVAFAYVALGDKAAAVGAFRRSLELQPGMELSPITTSPKILDAFREARKARPDTSPAPAAKAEDSAEERPGERAARKPAHKKGTSR